MMGYIYIAPSYVGQWVTNKDFVMGRQRAAEKVHCCLSEHKLWLSEGIFWALGG